MAGIPQNTGSLVVAVSTRRGTFPLAGALVTVSAQVDGRPTLYRVARTDQSGRTPVFELPAPAPSESLSPGQPLPYASYTVQVDADGYQSADALGVSVFPGIVATLPVWLEPSFSEPSHPQRLDFPPEVLDQAGGD